MSNCPRCGSSEGGSYSEGGHRWGLCTDCLDAERETAETIKTEYECSLCSDPVDRPGLCDICEEGITRED